MILRNLLLVVLALTTVSTLTGCAKLMGSLRRDLDDTEYEDRPTTGGLWAERGFLADDYPEGGDASRYVGHSERNPASGSGRSAYGSSWVTPERIEANRRDAGRWASEDGEDQVSPDNMPVLEPNVKRQYKNGSRATRADFVDESQNEGSLWASDGQTNYYFTKNKVRGVGDILTINIEQDLVRDMGLEARRTLTEKEREYELMAAQERIKSQAAGPADADGKKQDALASSASAPNRAPAGAAGSKDEKKEPAEVREATLADIDVSKSMEVKAGDPMLGEIIERYPNGNYKIRATKKIPYKGGAPRLMTLIGVVKGSDISEEDTVASGKLYEYRITASR